MTSTAVRLAALITLATLALPGAAVPAAAAVIAVRADVEPPVIVIDGTVEPRDLAVFMDRTRGLSQAVVRLRSLGGSILPAMEIGRQLHQLGFATEVHEFCDSACSLMWLAGTTRYLPPGSRVGFHQPREQNHAVSISGVALEASYLARLGLSDDAITWAVSAAPTQLKWLTAEDARRLDIAIVPGAAQTTAKSTAKRTESSIANSIAERLLPALPF